MNHLVDMTPPPVPARAMSGPHDVRGFDHLLDELTRTVAGSRYALVLSADGRAIASSSPLPENIDQIAFSAHALHHRASTSSVQLGGGMVRSTVLEMDNTLVVVAQAADTMRLVIVADIDVDLERLGFETTVTADRLSAIPGTCVTRDVRYQWR